MIEISNTDGIPGRISKTNYGVVARQRCLVCSMNELFTTLNVVNMELKQEMVEVATNIGAEAIVGYKIEITALNNEHFILSHIGTMCELSGSS